METIIDPIPVELLKAELTLEKNNFFKSILINAGIDEELYLKPDLDSFVILPWRPQQGS